MAMMNTDLSHAEVQTDSFSPVPDGEYLCTVCDSKIRTTRAGDQQLSLTYRIDAGDYKNRKVFDNFNLWSMNQQALEIAQRNLKTLATVAGHPNPNYIQDSSELHGLQFTIRIKTKEGENYPRHYYSKAKVQQPAAPVQQAYAPQQAAYQTPPPPPMNQAPVQGSELPWVRNGR